MRQYIGHVEKRSPLALDRDEALASILAWAAKTLAESGCEDARLDAELLLAHVLEQPRGYLLAHPEQPLTPERKEIFSRLLERRAQREPLAYIIGHCEFYGLEFYVDRRVLIPRPETELLVELALDYADKRRASRAPRPEFAEALPFRLADVGTGSGALAVSLAKALSNSVIYGLDVSEDALQVAAINCRRYGVTQKVILLPGDLLAPLPQVVDCIVANLPYVRQDEWETLAPEIRTYEPRIALDGGADGLSLIRRLLGQAAEHRMSGFAGHEWAIFLEIGPDQGPAVLSLSRQAFPDAEITLHQDYAGRDRVVAIKEKPA